MDLGVGFLKQQDPKLVPVRARKDGSAVLEAREVVIYRDLHPVPVLAELDSIEAFLVVASGNKKPFNL